MEEKRRLDEELLFGGMEATRLINLLYLHLKANNLESAVYHVQQRMPDKWFWEK